MALLLTNLSMRKSFYHSLALVSILLTLPFAASSFQDRRINKGAVDKRYKSNNGPPVYIVELGGHEYLLDTDALDLIKDPWKIYTAFPKDHSKYDKFTNFKRFHVIIFKLDGKAYPHILEELKGHYRQIS